MSGKRNSEDTKVVKTSDTGELLNHGEEKLGGGDNYVVWDNRNFEEENSEVASKKCPKTEGRGTPSIGVRKSPRPHS